MKCVRCDAVDAFELSAYCFNCGVHKDRPVRRIRRRKIGGKRGRNSGKVNSAKKK